MLFFAGVGSFGSLSRRTGGGRRVVVVVGRGIVVAVVTAVVIIAVVAVVVVAAHGSEGWTWFFFRVVGVEWDGDIGCGHKWTACCHA